ncbi:hypothetical protein B4R02_21880 [Salmonella enterica]|nr:hypothetical protein [Salmonella enterica subsp. diarizonae serovar 42:l,v:1,5,7]
MNYDSNEELRQDIARISNNVTDLYQQIISLEQKYRWSSDNLTQALAGQVLRVAHHDLSGVYRQIYELELIFQD